MNDKVFTKACDRVLNFLGKHGSADCGLFKDGLNTRAILSCKSNHQARMLCAVETLVDLERAKLVSKADGILRLLPLGEKRIIRTAESRKGRPEDGFQNQHRSLKVQTIRMDDDLQSVTVNQSESPLFRLSTRKSASGSPWIGEAAFVAGERLRADFTRSQLMQNVTANWKNYSTPINKTAGAGGKAELSDNAIDARGRMHQALDYVGPDLAAVLMDVCCFLKGLETVERERRWPPRSAKLMLRTGLELLARYYGTKIAGGRNARSMRSWGANGYRPSNSF